jgi:P pilus assembly chaperone PapD
MRFLFFVLIGIPQLVLASGLAVHPMEQFVKPSKSATYIASNNLDAAIAVEVICETWEITEEGEEMRVLTDELVAHPAQFLLKGNTYKKVRVALKTPERQIPVERTYRVTLRELPISLEPQEPGTFRIHHAAAYRTSFYLLPSSSKSRLEPGASQFAQGMLNLSVRNMGTTHVHLRNPVLYLTTESGEQVIITDKDILAPINGENMHAQIQRRFQLDLSSQDLPGPISAATLEFPEYELLQDTKLEFKW